MDRYIKRERYLEQLRAGRDDTDVVKVITGMRRCGKSVLLEMCCMEIMESGVP
ncbi:MAG: ATP-binding protein [Candidatus Methanomethylophilaceae archaeon]|nr:ATP-binding protein [Candidatus Methanomethylophilaceae archaeon]